MIAITIDKTAAENLTRNLANAEPRMKVAFEMAVAHAMDIVSKQAKDTLKRELLCDRGEIDSRIEISPVRQSDFTTSGVTIKSYPRIPLKRFQPDQTRTGVSVRVQRSRGARRYPHAFGPDIPRLGRNVFARQSRKRLPIRQLSGVSLTKVARSIGLDKILEVQARAQVRRQISRYMVAYAFGSIRVIGD